MKKDNFSKIFIGVLILHIIFIYIIPGFKEIIIEKPKISKVAIGITTQSIESAPKKIEKAKPVEEKEVVKVEKPKKEIPKVEKKVESKPQLQTTQSFDDLDLLAIEVSDRTISTKKEESKVNIEKQDTKKKDLVEDERKINDIPDPIEDVTITENLAEIVPELNEIDDELDDLKVEAKEDGLEDIKWENIASQEDPAIIGPKSGLKIGDIDGKSNVVWDPSNKDPEYPLEAEKKAQTADVTIILDIDPSGKVLKVKLIKTGVDVIDRAVESIARSWNIKLISNGMAISGSVKVTYQFKLKGRE
ncbi:MAG: TonB family protein [Psychrilyobacter sp.]|nr:TonB family protein [Psychrilyobacter sp.]